MAIPASHGGISAEAGHWPKGQTGTISGLTLHERQVAYSTTSGSESFGVTSLWLERLGGFPKLIDQVTSGASATCEHAFLSPTLLGGWLYAYLHDCDPYANPQSDRWTRYSLSGHGAQRAKFTFVHTGDEIIDSVVARRRRRRLEQRKRALPAGEHRLAHDQATRARNLLLARASALLSCRIPPLRALAFSSCGDDGAATGCERRSLVPAMAGGWRARGGIVAAGWSAPGHDGGHSIVARPSHAAGLCAPSRACARTCLARGRSGGGRSRGGRAALAAAVALRLCRSQAWRR